MNESPNEESQELSLSVKVIPVYAQLDLSIKELPPQANGTENVNESTNEEPQELPLSEVVEPVYD